jgi:hypothetical protein
MSKKPTRRKDSNQLAKFVLDAVTGDAKLPKKRLNGKKSAAVDQFQALVAGKVSAGVSLVDELIGERQENARRE